MTNRIRSLAMKIKGKVRKNRDFFYLRVLPIVMVCFMVVSIVPVYSGWGKASAKLSWFTFYPTSSSYSSANDGIVTAGTASSSGGASVYTPYAGSGQVVGWYIKNRNGGKGEKFAFTSSDRIAVERSVAQNYRDNSAATIGNIDRYANYMFPFTLNLKDRDGNIVYSGLVTPKIVSVSSPASSGATAQISVSIPRSAVDWAGNLSLYRSTSQQSGNGLSDVWLSYDDSTITLTYTAAPAKTSSSSSYVIRFSNYSYTTSDIVMLDIGNNYINYNPNGGKGKVYKGNETLGDGTRKIGKAHV